MQANMSGGAGCDEAHQSYQDEPINLKKGVGFGVIGRYIGLNTPRAQRKWADLCSS